jgi:GT2 family glycosyltransferase
VWPQASEGAVEVIVIDDASTDGTPAAVRDGFPEVRLLVNADNTGPARARNIAARAASGRLLLFLDSDGAVAPAWLDVMLAADDGETVLLGRTVDYGDGRLQQGPRRATFIGKSLPCRPERANTGGAGNLGVPRACFDTLQGFDEDIPLYFEDSDFCIRARKAGFRFRYLDGAVFRHKGSGLRHGEGITRQEHNSTYAMLKAYRGKPLHLALFTLLNGLWLILRLATWGLAGRPADAKRLWRGWTSAYARRHAATRRTKVDAS